MQPEQDFEQLKRQVSDSARRFLDRREPEQPPVTTGDIAADIGSEVPLVADAIRSLSGDTLQVEAGDDWQYAVIVGLQSH